VPVCVRMGGGIRRSGSLGWREAQHTASHVMGKMKRKINCERKKKR
jgi:hypothetical protein